MKRLKTWKRHFALLLSTALVLHTNAQSAVKLYGRVVEATPKGNIGVPRVTVSITDFSYDITDEQGFFAIGLPIDQPMIQIQLENAPHRMVSPLNGVVNLPPQTKSLEIVICGEKNKKLAAKVQKLNAQVLKLTKENGLSARKAEVLQRSMLDTILYYEHYVTSLLDENKESAGRIKVLEDSISSLVSALQVALGERYMQQKVHYEAISGELLSYLDRLKDFRDKCDPEKVNYYLVNQQAGNQLMATIEAYNKSRDPLLQHHTYHTLTVRKLWESDQAATKLEYLYRFILEDIHQKSILSIDNRAFEQIRKFATHHVARKKAENLAKDALSELLPTLNTQITQLESDIKNTLYLLDHSL